MGTIRFEIRTDKKDKAGQVPIRLIYQVAGQRAYFNAGKKLMPQCWDAAQQRAIYLDKKTAKKAAPSIDYDKLLAKSEADIINNHLIDLMRDVERIETRFELDKIKYDAEKVISTMKEAHKPNVIKKVPSKMLFDFIDQYIADHQNLRVNGSLQVYKSMKNHLQAYEKYTRKRVEFSKIDYSFFQSFQNFLISRKKMVGGVEVPLLNNTTIAKQLSTLKTFLGYARKHGIEIPDKYKDFTIKKEALEVIALSGKEFEALYYLDLSKNLRLAQVRDVFCFSCLTGLRYSDLKQLKREHIKADEITLTVQKTKEILMIPVTSLAQEILDRYIDQYWPLPMISNQKMNDYIKELCKIAGIFEPVEIVRYRGNKREAVVFPKCELIGVHAGRKTFVTLSLEKGMSAEEVMSITGHKDYKSFKRYVRVSEQRKKIVMLKAWG